MFIFIICMVLFRTDCNSSSVWKTPPEIICVLYDVDYRLSSTKKSPMSIHSRGLVASLAHSPWFQHYYSLLRPIASVSCTSWKNTWLCFIQSAMKNIYHNIKMLIVAIINIQIYIIYQKMVITIILIWYRI